MKRDEIIKDIIDTIEKIEDKEIRNITKSIFVDRKITFLKLEPKISFEESPAAPKIHHAYPGGLIDHLYGVLMLSLNIGDTISRVYKINVNKDLLISGAVLHDIYKFYQYEIDPVTGGFRSRQDFFLPHDFTIIAELAHRKAPPILIRLMAEMHGRSPVSMVESRILHYSDSTDAKFVSQIQDIIWKACKDVETESNGKILAIKSFYKALKTHPIFELAETYFLKGIDELRKIIRETYDEELGD